MRPMRVTVCCTDTKIPPWLEGLRAALPEADVQEWRPGAAPADYAVVWAPPQHAEPQHADGEVGPWARLAEGPPALGHIALVAVELPEVADHRMADELCHLHRHPGVVEPHDQCS